MCVAWLKVHLFNIAPCSLVVEFLGGNTSDFATLSLETFSRSWLVISLKMWFQCYFLWAMICTKMGKLDTLSSEIIPEHGWVGHVRGEEQGR
jgi:hypothetical protein